jgi:ADP-ribose pyrophosphatase YjhB (NUDIX family)
MAFIVTREVELSILLAQSPYHGMWMPPQEGVRLSESFPEALRRCLEVECGLDLPGDPKSLARYFHVRSYRFMGVLELPPERHGERLVADDAVGTALESVTLKRKAYWMATVVVGSPSDIAPEPDGKEIVNLRWFPFRDASEVISTTNHEPKAALLVRSLEACRRDLQGGSPPGQTQS